MKVSNSKIANFGDRKKNMPFGDILQELVFVLSWRFNDGVTDIRGNVIRMITEPTIVFKEAQLGASVTK